jgi:hypothetical protein
VIENLTENEQLLLMAAAAQGFGPETDLSTANTYKVVRQIVYWSQIDETIFDGWCEQQFESPELDEIYRTLVGLVDQTPNRNGLSAGRPGPALFEGAGSWGNPDGDPPCATRFNACRLTSLGEEQARRLLVRYPQYRDAAPPPGTRLP